MKQLLLICAVVVLVGCSNDTRKAEPLPAPHTPEDKPKTAQAAEAEAVLVNIADPTLEKAVRHMLSKPEGELTEADLQNLTSLSLGLTNITEKGLKELAELKNLFYLELAGTDITDKGTKELAKLKNS